MRKMFAIMIAMMLLSVSFASAGLIGSGGKAPIVQPAQGTTTPAATSTPTPATGTSTGSVLPAAPQPNAFLWRSSGTQYKIYDQKTDNPGEGYTLTGSYILTPQNLEVVSANKENELVTIANNKVGFKSPDSPSTTMSVGGTNFMWSGPDKFSYDSAKNQVLFDSKPISFAAAVDTGEYHFLDETGAQTQNYIKPVTGGMLRNDENGVAIYDSKGKVINTFSQDEWAGWSDNFKAVGDTNYVAAAFAVKDQGLDPEDVTVEGRNWKIKDGDRKSVV